MGNTQATDKQFSDRYALKSVYDGTVVIVDQHTSQIAGIINSANQLAAKVDVNRTAYDNYVTTTNKTISDNRLAYDNYVKVTDKTISDNKLAYDAYVNTTNGSLTAIGNRITNEITAATKLSSDAIKVVASDLAILGTKVTGIDTNFTSRFNSLESNLASYKLSNDASLKTLSDAYNAFVANLKSNYKFDKVNIGNDWFFHTQSFNNVDNLCIGKNIAGTNKLLMCLDTSGNLNYSSMNQNSTFGSVPVIVPTVTTAPTTTTTTTTTITPTTTTTSLTSSTFANASRQLNQSCFDSADCAIGGCTNGICLPISSTYLSGSRNTSESCFDTSDCKTGLMCDNYICG